MKTQPARVRGVRNQREGGGFFRQRHGVGAFAADDFVQALEKRNRFQIFAPAMHIWNPFTRLAAVIAVEHGGHRIHPQPIDTKTLQPIERVADEEIRHLGAPPVVDEGIPILVKALARVGVFVKVCAIETRQPVRIGRKMRRNPIHNHANARRVATLHQPHQSIQRTKARGRRIQANRLIAP